MKQKISIGNQKLKVVVTHPSFGISAIYCAEQYAKVKVQREPDGFFSKKLDLPIIAYAQTTGGDLNKQVDTYVIDKMGQSTRSEDIALARSQGLDVDDDNELTQENIPAARACIDNNTNLHGHKWGWSGTCYQHIKHHLDVDLQILNYSRSDCCNQTKLDMFPLFFPLNCLENVRVKETSRTLVVQAFRYRCTISINSLHAMYPMYTMFYLGDKGVCVKLSIGAPKKQLNMEN